MIYLFPSISSIYIHIIILCAASWVIYYIVSDMLLKTKKYSSTKGPFAFPFIGNNLQLLWNYRRRLEWLQEMTKKYGDVWSLHIMGVKGTFISTPDLVEYILKTKFENYPKGEIFYNRGKDLLGNGIFNVDGNHWKVQRKTGSHMFSVRMLRDTMTKVFLHHGDEFLKKVGDLHDSTLYFDIQDLYFRYTLDSIGEIAYGFDINSLKNRDVPFAKAFDQANSTIEFRFVNPFWRICRWILPSEYQMRESIQVVTSFAQSIIDDRRKMVDEGKEPTDLLSRFIFMKDDNGRPFTDAYLRDIILNFIIAGRDTTANALSWTTYFLCMHPNVQEKAREEIARVLKDRELDYETVKELDYLHCIVHETLRMYPSVPIEIKTVAEDDTLPTGHKVHKGELIAFSPFIINRSSQVWDQPEKFKPERWFDAKPNAFTYPTFNAGPRTCLGQNMALLEAQILLAKLIPVRVDSE